MASAASVIYPLTSIDLLTPKLPAPETRSCYNVGQTLQAKLGYFENKLSFGCTHEKIQAAGFRAGRTFRVDGVQVWQAQESM